jgi:hypothetical protein
VAFTGKADRIDLQIVPDLDDLTPAHLRPRSGQRRGCAERQERRDSLAQQLQTLGGIAAP